MKTNLKPLIFILSVIIGLSTQAQFGNLKSNFSNKTAKSSTQSTSGDHGATNSSGKDYYISPNGHGRSATKAQPAKDLAAVIMKLKDGDVIHIAGGTYVSKSGRGSDVINKSVTIIGGYSPDFSTRDPWGKYKTILTGTNKYGGLTTARLRINGSYRAPVVIDGIIIDNGPRNRYKTEKHQLILRKANASKGENPSPETPGIKILMKGADCSVKVQNCVIMNTAPTQGALDVQLGKNGKAVIKNNLIVNNTGEGIMAKTNWHGDSQPDFATYIIENNTILFSWKHDAIASYGGNSLMLDTDVNLTANNNIFGFGDVGGVNNIKLCKNLILNNNNFFGHKKYDFFDTSAMNVSDMADYADYLKDGSGNVSEPVKLALNKDWGGLYASRKEISRASVDASSTVSNSAENQVRGILGLNKMGSSVKMDADIWLHQMQVDDAVKLGLQQYNGKGCQKP